jgi:hypothetical protein
MIQSAVNNVAFVVINPDVFRFPQKSDHFKIELVADNARQYYITNTSTSSQYLVTFAVAANGNRLAACTCPDFANIRKHGRQCKHINVAYQYHVARCKAKQVAEKVVASATTAPAAAVTLKVISPYLTVTVTADGVEKVGGFRI